MTERMQVAPGDRLLEIGTGSGYQAAVLAELAGWVYTVELLEPLARAAIARLERLEYSNVTLQCGNGYEGWADEAPFDGIIVTAAPQSLPHLLVEQLKVGGRMVLPVGARAQDLILVTRERSGTREERIAPVRFVPMRQKV